MTQCKQQKELKRQSTETAVLPPAPELEATSKEWAAWGQTAAEQAKGILSAGGESFCGGKCGRFFPCPLPLARLVARPRR
eukprot:scaffold51944_cov110-Phaeocystis_antarctica.AAC.4